MKRAVIANFGANTTLTVLFIDFKGYFINLVLFLIFNLKCLKLSVIISSNIINP